MPPPQPVPPMFQLAESRSSGTPWIVKTTSSPISGLLGDQLMVGLTLPLPTVIDLVLIELSDPFDAVRVTW